MDPKFIKTVQDKGWRVDAVTESSVICKCPAAGCSLRAEIQENGHVPAVDPGQRRDMIDQPIASYDDIRRMLRSRREELRLAMSEVEDIAGFSSDHLAKIEKESIERQPNAQMLIEWANALGFEIVLRPAPLTPFAVRVICDTRSKIESRTRRFNVEKRRRETRKTSPGR